jgi:LysM repeat protein
MDADKKLGFALGILLCGIVGAFFFRDEAEPKNKQPQLADASKLDDQIRQKAQTPYLPDGKSVDMTQIPDALASDVMPQIPGDQLSNTPTVIPEPIRPTVSDNNDIDVVTPIPSSNDAHLDAAFDRANLKNNVLPSVANSDQPRLSQTVQPNDGPTKPATRENQKWITHEVVDGDTLSQIASRYLGTHRRFKEVYEHNKDVLKSPNAIRTGMKLRIPVGPQTASNVKPNTSGTTTETKSDGAAGAVTPKRTGELFERPPRSPLSPIPRVTQAPGGSLSQRPPIDVPHVEGLLDPRVIASRLKADDRTQKKSDKTARD